MNIRRLKAGYAIYNFFHRSALTHNLPLYKKHGIRKRYFDPVSSADFKGMEGAVNRFDHFDSAELLPLEPAFQKLKPSYQEALKNWSSNGYAILESFVAPERVEKINTEIEKMVADKTIKFVYGKKLMFAFQKSRLIRDLGEEPALKTMLGLLMGKEVDLFQSINFVMGSEQRTHSDSIHMSTFPTGNLIAIWVALEDVSNDQGPLHYYPGSHKLPYILNSEFGNAGTRYMLGKKNYSDYEDEIENVLKANPFERKTFLAKKGDIFIWHANLLHGGNKMNNKQLTRKSMVFHYYTSDAICYHEITQRPTLKR